MSQKKHLTNFIHSLMEKKYSEAQTFLGLAIESKMKDRIKGAKEKSKKSKSKKDEDKKDDSKKVSGKDAKNNKFLAMIKKKKK